jgi:SAM-dependent methyltransferase
MSDLPAHYTSGRPYEQVSAALEQIASGGAPIAFADLNGFDDFHTGGRVATEMIAGLLNPAATDTVLDAGCGLGGPARYLADRFGCRVIGIDLTPDFVEIGRLLNERTGMSELVDLRVGDITALDLPDASVDHVITQHVAMNIADREGLYAETRRAMRTGGRFVVFDVIDGGGGELLLPVPWATKPEHSHLVTREQLRSLLTGAGFSIEVWEDPTEEMVEVLRVMLAPPPPGSAPPPLSSRLFIDDAVTKLAKYFRNVEEQRTAIALGVCTAI